MKVYRATSRSPFVIVEGTREGAISERLLDAIVAVCPVWREPVSGPNSLLTGHHISTATVQRVLCRHAPTSKEQVASSTNQMRFTTMDVVIGHLRLHDRGGSRRPGPYSEVSPSSQYRSSRSTPRSPVRRIKPVTCTRSAAPHHQRHPQARRRCN